MAGLVKEKEKQDELGGWHREAMLAPFWRRDRKEVLGRLLGGHFNYQWLDWGQVR